MPETLRSSSPFPLRSSSISSLLLLALLVVSIGSGATMGCLQRFGFAGEQDTNDSVTRLDVSSRVNEATAGRQSHARVAQTEDGTYVVVWQGDLPSSPTGALHREVYWRTISPLGVPVGSEVPIADPTATDRRAPEVVTWDNGSFVVVWNESPRELRARELTDDGVPLAAVMNLSGGDIPSASEPMMTSCGLSRDFVLFFEQGYGDLGGNWNVGLWGWVYDHTGSTTFGKLHANTFVDGTQTSPSCTALGNDHMMVVWHSTDQESSGTGIYGQGFAGDVPLGAELHVNSTEPGDQMNPAVAFIPTGGVVVVWQSTDQDGSGSGIIARKLSDDGTSQGPELVVNEATAGDQQSPTLVATSHGDVLVLWESFGGDGSGWAVVGRFLHAQADLAAAGGEFIVNSSTEGNQRSARAAQGANGHLLIVWEGEGPGDDEGVFLRLIPEDPG